MAHQVKFWASALLTAALLALVFPALGQDIATFEIGPSMIDFRPLVSHEGAILTISSPRGEVIRRELEASSVLSVNLRDIFGADLPDGSYRFELSLQPKLDAATREELLAARAQGDDGAVARLRAGGRLPAPMIQRGSFTVLGGTIIGPGQTELPASPRRPSNGSSEVATRDTIADSLCIGLDCPASPAFNDSTLLLMENNTRIKFDDTSASAGFAKNDWEIEANSSVSGGPAQLAVNDCGDSSQGGCADDPLLVIEAGAPAHSLFVDSTGHIGFSTTNPVLSLHVTKSVDPGLRLEQTNSGGFTPYTWDIVGNEANFFIRDVTGGLRLPFRIQPGAPSSSLDIDNDGDVGMGTNNPSASLEIVRSGAASEVMATTYSSDGNLFPNFIQRRAGGSAAAPAATQADNIIGSYSFRGHDGTSFSTNNIARLEVRAEQSFTPSAQGTRMIFQTTANGSITPTTRMVIKNDGSVGIGTNNPTAGSRLEVSGGHIRVTGGSFIDDGTTLAVPDYVFEPGYELRSVEELAAFVAQHKHLPGVPSRDEVKQNGLNLSQFQMRLLEKLEELTLYTIELKRSLAEHQARLAALERAKP